LPWANLGSGWTVTVWEALALAVANASLAVTVTVAVNAPVEKYGLVSSMGVVVVMSVIPSLLKSHAYELIGTEVPSRAHELPDASKWTVSVTKIADGLDVKGPLTVRVAVHVSVVVRIVSVPSLAVLLAVFVSPGTVLAVAVIK